MLINDYALVLIHSRFDHSFTKTYLRYAEHTL